MPRVVVKAIFDNIRFKCQRCGSCCHHKRPLEFDDLIPAEQIEDFWRSSNLIYLTEKDVHAISNRTGMRPPDFVDTLYDYSECYVKIEDEGRRVILDLPVLKSKEDTTCVLPGGMQHLFCAADRLPALSLSGGGGDAGQW